MEGWQEDAVAKLRASGWWQKSMGQREGRVDLMDVMPMRPEITAAVRRSIAALFPERAAECVSKNVPGVLSLTEFNDHPGTTQADVERVILEAR